MTQTDNHLPFNEDELKRTLNNLQGAFPQLETFPLHHEVLSSPYLPRLSRLLKLFIPIDAFPQKIKELYHQISNFYHCHIFRMDGTELDQRREVQLNQRAIIGNEVLQPQEERSSSCDQDEKIPAKFNYKDLATFVNNFSVEQESNVSRELIQMGRTFSSWGVKEAEPLEFPKIKMQKKESKPENSEFKYGKDKYQKTEAVKNQSVKILLGKNISLECKEMRDEILERAKSNKLLKDNTELTDLEKIGIQINYILNRITVEYFSEFLEELRPYAKDQIYSFVLTEKIIEKVMEEHNFISIYCRLVKRLKNVSVTLGENKLRFKKIFVSKLQETFYGLIRKGEWSQKEEFYKKQLIGMSLFVGQLFNVRFLSKYVFKDCFYELIRSYIIQYQKYKTNKAIFYYETYIQCVIKIVQKMNNYYDELLQKKTTNNLHSVMNQLLESPTKEDQNFTHICDYIELLRIINEKLPSQRFKITFLLEDFRCSKVLNRERETLNNSQFDIIKSILSIDIHNKQDVSKIPEMVSGSKPETLMKDFFYQFAEGNLKQVSKHIDLFKIMAESSGICSATISSLRDNIEGLFIIESDFPFLCQGLAKILKIVCDEKKLSFQELKLGEEDHEDDDIREFLQKVQEKYYKMIMQD